MSTVHGLLERNARKYSMKVALITKTCRLTYQQLNQLANQMARHLSHNGITRGKKVAILAKNNEYFLFSYFSLLKLGAIPVPVNVQFTNEELNTIFNRLEVDGLLYQNQFKPFIKTKNPLTFLQEIEIAYIDSIDYDKCDLNLPTHSCDPCEILLTSGTTGVPKGVLFSHNQLFAIASGLSLGFGFSNQDRYLNLMPLTHSAPLNCFLISHLYCGASIILDDFSPQAFLNWIHEEKATFTFAAPIAYQLVAKEANVAEFDLSSIRVFAYGGSAMPLAAYQSVTDVFQNKNFYQVYGLTEAGPNGSLLKPEEHLTKPGSIGRDPIINMEMRIITDLGNEAQVGEYGELLMRGDSLMTGYYNNEKATSETIQDGWLHTGDIAYQDADGYMYIVDRLKDVIIPGGINVYPREIEEVLSKHPKVDQVCVVGVPDQEWGETVKAVIVLQHNAHVTADELKAYMKQHLAEFKIPRLYSFVQALPHTASGKVLKDKVKEM
jgi:acyl-CoA synthetase (AMP-forming)/AMP-acid ligase II